MVSDGLLDTNVLVHSILDDIPSEECRKFLAMVEAGERRVRLEVYVVHELTFVLGRVRRQMSRQEIVEFLYQVIEWPGIECDRELLIGTLDRWQQRKGIAFVDALLATQARLSNTRIFSKNVREFRDTGIEVPEPLWNYTP
jgi:predicted nucleic acid-binding protein